MGERHRIALQLASKRDEVPRSGAPRRCVVTVRVREHEDASSWPFACGTRDAVFQTAFTGPFTEASRRRGKAAAAGNQPGVGTENLSGKPPA